MNRSVLLHRSGQTMEIPGQSLNSIVLFRRCCIARQEPGDFIGRLFATSTLVPVVFISTGEAVAAPRPAASRKPFLRQNLKGTG